jgi:hypothetical protein
MGQKLQNSQQLMIFAAIGLAVLLYFKHKRRSCRRFSDHDHLSRQYHDGESSP